MAGKKTLTEELEKRNIKVKAKVNLKYDKDIVKAGVEFLIRESDVKAIEQYVEVIGKVEENEANSDADS